MAEGFAPPKFSGDDTNSCESWMQYKEDLDTYLYATDLISKPGKRKVAVLLYGMGSKYKKIFNTFTFDRPEDKENFNTVIRKFDAHFEPKKLTKLYMKRFDECFQKENENIGDYIARLKDIAQYCDFGDTLNNQLCKQISSGVRSRELKDKLWSEDLTLEQIINKAHLYEQKVQSKELLYPKSSEVHFTRGGRWRGRGRGAQRYGRDETHVRSGQQQRGRGAAQGMQRRQQFPSCTHCGKNHPRGQCPAYGQLCRSCGKRNHYARMCRQKKRVYETETYENDYELENDYEYELVENFSDVNVWFNSKVAGTKPSWSKMFYVNNAQSDITFKLDTGAETSVLSLSTYDNFMVKPNLRVSKTRIYGLGKQEVHPIGKTTLSLTHNNQNHDVECEIVSEKVPNLLCLSDCLKMKLIKLVGNVQTKVSDRNLNVNSGKSGYKSVGDININAKKVVLTGKNEKTNTKWPESVTNCPYETTKQMIMSYPDCFTGLGKVPGEVSLKIDPSFTPVAHPPRPIPAALREKAKAKLDHLEELAIIERVPVGTPTPWCSSLHIVPKKNNDVRITIDPRDLNAALIREYHPTNTVEQVAQRVCGAKYITILDANQGYFQICLDNDSKDYTAFNTPFGRYRYTRLPMGIKSAPELFQRIFGDIFADVNGLQLIMDDFIIAAETLTEHNKILEETLKTARTYGVTFSLAKIQLGTANAKFSGQIFTDKGLKMDPDRIKAIVEMPEPTNIKEVHTLLGMVTYVCKYLQSISSICEPLRSLLKEANQKGFKWHFDQIHKEAFQNIKDAMTKDPVLQYYSLTKPIVISCDASQSGLGCVIMQDDLPVAYGSKALTDAECAYAQIEKEALAIVFALTKFHTYVYGRSDVTVQTDHLPLLRIMEKPLHLVPLRLQKMRMRIQGYDFKLIAKKGTEIPVADCLSRAYISDKQPVNLFEVQAEEITTLQLCSDKRIQEIQEKTKADEALQTVIKMISHGWPEHRRGLQAEATPYFDSKDELTVVNGIVYKGMRIVIPTTMRTEALKVLHTAHQGMVKTKQLARDLMYWPGINSQIEDMVGRCSTCQERRPAQPKEPLIPMPVPSRPWEHVAQDLFECLGSK